MNTKKILQQLVAERFKTKDVIRLNEYEFHEDTTRKVVAVTYDQYAAYFVPAKDFLLDIDKLLNGRSRFDFSFILKNEANARPARMTEEAKKLNGGITVKLESEKDRAWINPKLLALFDKDCSFKIISEKCPVYVYEDKRLAGFILPVIVKEE